MLARTYIAASLLAVQSVCAIPASAVPVPELYAATVPVETRQREPAARDFARALDAVLVKVTGQRGAGSGPPADALLEQAARYALQHGYREQGQLWVGFDANAVRQALLELGLPIWGQDRPATLVWLAVDFSAGQRDLIGADDSGGLRELLEERAAERGIPLIFPLLDAEDLAALTFADVWGGFLAKIDVASARYRPDAVLVGRASSAGGGPLLVRWMLLQGGINEEWRGLLEDGVERTADLFAARFATTGAGSERSISIAVSQVQTLRAYASVLSYLEALTLVRRVTVDRVNGDTVYFRLAALGEPEKLRREIELSGFLQAAGDVPSHDATGFGAFHYQYQP